MSHLQVENGRGIYYESYQGSNPAVVLIHGWGMHTRIWDPTIAALRGAGYAVVSFDQRGCGRSDKDFAMVSIDAAVSDVVQLVESLSLSSVVLHGWSLGAAIAVGAAARLGTRCKGVISVGGATPRLVQGEGWPYGMAPGAATALCHSLATERATSLAGFMSVMFAVQVDTATSHWAAQTLLESAQSADAALLDLEKLDQRAILAELAVPFLAILGCRDVLVQPELVRQAATIPRNGTVVEFEHSGHAPFIEEREKYAKTLLNFLALLR
jgi:non-heme chloroperoxidase